MKYIVVQFDFEGVHSWPGVIDHQELGDVQFLQYPHRHLFAVKMKREVSHNDRDVEIINFKREVELYVFSRYGRNPANIGSRSCEMMAEELSTVFGLKSCEVLEDGENGAEYVAD